MVHLGLLEKVDDDNAPRDTWETAYDAHARAAARAAAAHGRWRCLLGWHCWVTVSDWHLLLRSRVNIPSAFDWFCATCDAEFPERRITNARLARERAAAADRERRESMQAAVVRATEIAAAQRIVERLQARTAGAGEEIEDEDEVPG